MTSVLMTDERCGRQPGSTWSPQQPNGAEGTLPWSLWRGRPCPLLDLSLQN